LRWSGNAVGGFGFAARSAGFCSESSFELLVELGGRERARRFAEALDVVEGAALGEEDVDNEVNVIEEDPTALTAAFDGVGVGTKVAFENELDFVGNGLCLPVVER